MIRRKKFKKLIFTKTDFLIGNLAIFIVLIIAFINLESDWGKFVLLQGMLCIIGLYGTSYLYYGKFIPPFKENDINSIFRIFLIALISMSIQALITLTFAISDVERALYYVFAAVCEEMFFRCFIINVIQKYTNIPTLVINIFQSICFTAIHINYYGQWNKIIGVFIGGFMLGYVYIIWNDLTSNILGHMLNNFIAVGNQFLWPTFIGNPTIMILLIIFLAIILICSIFSNKLSKKYKILISSLIIIILLICILSFFIKLPIYPYGAN